MHKGSSLATEILRVDIKDEIDAKDSAFCSLFVFPGSMDILLFLREIILFCRSSIEYRL